MNKKDEITAYYLQHTILKEIDAKHLTPAGAAYVKSVWDGMLEAFESHSGESDDNAPSENNN